MFEELAERIAASKERIQHMGENADGGLDYLAQYSRSTSLAIGMESALVDGEVWARMSVLAMVGGKPQAPRWDEVLWAKRVFLGDDVQACIGIPARTMSAHPHMMRVWAPLERNALPTFSVDAPTSLVPI